MEGSLGDKRPVSRLLYGDGEPEISRLLCGDGEFYELVSPYEMPSDFNSSNIVSGYFKSDALLDSALELLCDVLISVGGQWHHFFFIVTSCDYLS